VDDFFDRVLQYMLEGGAITQKQYKAVRSSSIFYVPLLRVFLTDEIVSQ
jgi:hypothetical protein